MNFQLTEQQEMLRAVTREFAWLDAQGLVVKEGRALKIPSLAKLRQLVEEDWAE